MLYAKHGAKLVIHGRNEEKLKKTANLCEEQGILKENVRRICSIEMIYLCNAIPLILGKLLDKGSTIVVLNFVKMNMLTFIDIILLKT